MTIWWNRWHFKFSGMKVILLKIVRRNCLSSHMICESYTWVHIRIHHYEKMRGLQSLARPKSAHMTWSQDSWNHELTPSYGILTWSHESSLYLIRKYKPFQLVRNKIQTVVAKFHKLLKIFIVKNIFHQIHQYMFN